MIGYRPLLSSCRCAVVRAAMLSILAAIVLLPTLSGAQDAALTQLRKTGTKIKPVVQPVIKPVVVLSAEHRKLCRVVVGDTMPKIKLPDDGGTAHDLHAVLGKKLTVVVFWNAQHRYALAEFRHLQTEVLKPFAKRGVAVVAIHVGKPPENYKNLLTQYGKGIVCLTDADRSAFDLVAKGKLPRTYLLDANGKVLWLDLEYSRTTRFDLRNAIRYFTQP